MSDESGRKKCVTWKRVIVFAVLLAVTIGVSFHVGGCYHYRVTTESTKTRVYRETRHVMFWGLVGEPVILRANEDDVSRQCSSGTIREVRVSTNFGYSLVTVLTLGIWSPAEVEWECAPPPVDEGDIDGE